MKVTLNNKVYDLTYNSQVGVNYRYEVMWGESFAEDNHDEGSNIAIMRLVYAILENSNPKTLELEFDDFVSAIDDEQFLEIVNWLKERFEYFSQAVADKNSDDTEGEGKNA